MNRTTNTNKNTNTSSGALASPTILDLRNAVRTSIPAGTERVIVGCSGGPDSLVLTAVASWVGERAGFQVHSVTVDHQLQENSADIARIATEHALAVGATSAEVVTVNVGGRGGHGGHGGMEAAARIARREALMSAANGVPILLGHTANDQAETVLLRLLRGAGSHSLSAMSAVDHPCYRPFLGNTRADIELAVQELLTPLGITPWADPHNQSHDFARVRMRDHLQRLTEDFGPSLVWSLVRTADLARADDRALEDLAEEFVAAQSFANPQDLYVSIDSLAKLPVAVRSRVIRRMYAQCAAVERESSPLTYNHMQTIDALISDWHGQGEIALPLGVCAVREYDRLRLYRDKNNRVNSFHDEGDPHGF